MKVGDSVRLRNNWRATMWWRVGLVLGFERGYVLVYWGEDFPYEEEYLEQLELVA